MLRKFIEPKKRRSPTQTKPREKSRKTPVLCFRQDELLNPIIPMLRKFIEPKKRRSPPQT